MNIGELAGKGLNVLKGMPGQLLEVLLPWPLPWGSSCVKMLMGRDLFHMVSEIRPLAGKDYFKA